MDLGQHLITSASVGVTLGVGAGYALNRWLRGRADAAALDEARERRRDEPRSLYPVVDPDLCIGSLACLKACPEGDILGLVDGMPTLIRGQDCIGHGRCAAECPVSAITLVFGSARRGVDLPEVGDGFESSRPGVHVIGELGGMGLIKNAMRQGLQVGDWLAQRRQPASDGVADVCIVGAGPAGLAAALALTHHGMSFRLLEQDRLGGAIASYPRRKIVMSEPVHLPIWGKFGKKRMLKEELLETIERLVAKARIEVEQGVKVEGVEGEDGDFTVQTSQGPVRARKVVLAVGRRGSPRKLGVPGEQQTKVVYRLDHPEQYDGARVLVVGAGDSGVEAACQLARESSAEVWLSFRGDAPKCREPNRQQMEELERSGRLTPLARSQVRSIGEREVTLDVGGAATTIPNDFVIVNIGGELPTQFLEKAGVGMRRYTGEALGSPRPDGDRPSRQRWRSAEEQAARRRLLRLELGLGLLGAAVVGFLAWRGWAYYVLPSAERIRSPMHALFRPSGGWGHGLGFASTAFMLCNLAYALRKRVDRLSGLGDMRTWLVVHVFAGLMSPLLMPFHSAFQSRNLLATGTAVALVVVVLTGIVGRYLFSLVPAAAGHTLELEELQSRFVRARTHLEPLLERLPDPEPVKALFDAVVGPLRPRWFLTALLRFPVRSLRFRAALRRLAHLFPDEASRADFRDDLLQCQRLRLQIGFYRTLKSLMRSWRILHASLAAFLVIAIALHVFVCLYLGYGRG